MMSDFLSCMTNREVSRIAHLSEFESFSLLVFSHLTSSFKQILLSVNLRAICSACAKPRRGQVFNHNSTVVHKVSANSRFLAFSDPEAVHPQRYASISSLLIFQALLDSLIHHCGMHHDACRSMAARVAGRREGFSARARKRSSLVQAFGP